MAALLSDDNIQERCIRSRRIRASDVTSHLVPHRMTVALLPWWATWTDQKSNFLTEKSTEENVEFIRIIVTYIIIRAFLALCDLRSLPESICNAMSSFACSSFVQALQVLLVLELRVHSNQCLYSNNKEDAAQNNAHTSCRRFLHTWNAKEFWCKVHNSFAKTILVIIWEKAIKSPKRPNVKLPHALHGNRFAVRTEAFSHSMPRLLRTCPSTVRAPMKQWKGAKEGVSAPSLTLTIFFIFILYKNNIGWCWCGGDGRAQTITFFNIIPHFLCSENIHFQTLCVILILILFPPLFRPHRTQNRLKVSSIICIIFQVRLRIQRSFR